MPLLTASLTCRHVMLYLCNGSPILFFIIFCVCLPVCLPASCLLIKRRRRPRQGRRRPIVPNLFHPYTPPVIILYKILHSYFLLPSTWTPSWIWGQDLLYSSAGRPCRSLAPPSMAIYYNNTSLDDDLITQCCPCQYRMLAGPFDLRPMQCAMHRH